MQIFSATVNGELIGEADTRAAALRQCLAWAALRGIVISGVAVANVLPGDLSLRPVNGIVLAWVAQP